MPHKPVPYKVWVSWLKSKGLVKITHLCKKGSHEAWNYPKGKKQLQRPIIFRQTKQEIPADHIATCIRTLGISKSKFYKEVRIK